MEDNVNVKVAYADDHELVRKGIISFIEQDEHIKVIIEAKNGKILLEKLEKIQHMPDCVLLDINMPVMDGFETLINIRNKWPELKVLVLTAFDTEMYIIRMIQLGANGYLLKNSSPNEFKEALLTLMRNDYYYSSVAGSRVFNKVLNGELKLPHFTEHEIDFLRCCPSDLSYAEIAQKLNTTKKAVESCRDRLCDKLDVNSRTGLALYAVQFGLYQLVSKKIPAKGIFGK